MKEIIQGLLSEVLALSNNTIAGVIIGWTMSSVFIAEIYKLTIWSKK